MDLKNLVKPDQFDLLKNVKKIFFYRICGTGMGAAACLLKEKGYVVEGADQNFYPPMSDYLASTGITCHKLDEYDTERIKDFDLIVVGNVVPRNSEDAQKIESLGVPFISFPMVLGLFVLSKENVVGIAGTHGKTTTSFFMTQILENLGKKPGYFIGGVIEGRAPSRLGDGSYFIIESDEYDSAYFEKISKFRSYNIDHLILTSLEFDHGDIFESLEDIKNEFRELIPNVSGHHIYCAGYPASRELSFEFSKNNSVDWYGFESDSGTTTISTDEKGTVFSLKWNGDLLEFQTNIVGDHNIENISACILFCLKEGFSKEEVQSAIQNLALVKRRQEIRGKYDQAIIVDDFAHHPRAVFATIQAIRSRFKNRKIKVIFEPHSATARSSLFQEGFFEAFLTADEVYITKLPRSTTAKGAEDLDVKSLVKRIEEKNITSGMLESVDDVITMVKQASKEPSVVLVLSNGTCLGFWQSEFINAFDE